MCLFAHMGRKEAIMRQIMINKTEKLNSTYAKGGLRVGHLSDR